eukprot:6554181-Alexandrium_andersonii.AAC.1
MSVMPQAARGAELSRAGTSAGVTTEVARLPNSRRAPTVPRTGAHRSYVSHDKCRALRTPRPTP